MSDLTKLHRALTTPETWLGGPGAKGLAVAYAKRVRQIRKYGGRGPVVVAELETAKFLAGVLAAVGERRAVVLANPRWGEIERAQAAAQIKPGLWLGPREARWPVNKSYPTFDIADWKEAILIPTGGTGGRVRWAVHTWETLAAAARALAEFLDAEGCLHVSTLPPWHVSGLMPAVRAIEAGGVLWLENWKTLEAGRPPAIGPERAIISLVPTQLQRLWKRKKVSDWLRGTRAILLGGAAPPPGLLERARELRLPIALAYGMTETAAVVAAQKPVEFLAGKPPRATALPHAKISMGKDGRILIRAKSLFAGYYPARRKAGPFATEDGGKLDEQGRLQLLGRLDNVIVSGGEKVDPREVEKQIRATGLVNGVRVVGLPDAEWGERVTAIYTGKVQSGKAFHAVLKKKLRAIAIPKTWIHAKTLPKPGQKFS